MNKLIKYIGENDYHDLEKNKLYFVSDSISGDSCEVFRSYGTLYKNEDYIDVSKEDVINYIHDRLDEEIQEMQQSIENRDRYLMSNDPYFTFCDCGVDDKTQATLNKIHSEFPILYDKVAFLQLLKEYINDSNNIQLKYMEHLTNED
ncbi:hypothetical protein [Clostridium botulinum]|uniref:hypothetical protein n=1 Tax=Clostridium botulinum TaxID=1491 RepID=UPI0004DA26F2|nr:hypothetical protein [Clostridium botulinum]KEH99724.1 hypothetical protein Z952_p0048 [Clostridium botulinum C/D str. BKT75002]KEI05202.1 hypothetical protein Z954_0048 [Clostridium botulinum C/D str. BKT2873]